MIDTIFHTLRIFAKLQLFQKQTKKEFLSFILNKPVKFIESVCKKANAIARKVDSEIVKMVKSWHFSPLYDINAPNYEWGIVSIKIQK